MDRWLLDPHVQWRHADNIWHNAQVGTLLDQLAAPVRWAGRLFMRK